MKFSALNVDFSSPCLDPVGSRRSAHMGVREGSPSKNGYLFTVGLSSMKMIADRQRMLLIITSTGDELLKNVNVDDLE